MLPYQRAQLVHRVLVGLRVGHFQVTRARQFDLAGGDIRNVALEAAFLAADDGGVIGMRPIVHALARQLAKQGKTPTSGDFHQYQCLLV